MLKKQLFLLSTIILSFVFSGNKQPHKDVISYDRIYLKNGSILIGEIEDRSQDPMKVKLRSKMIKYVYQEEVALIEEDEIKIKTPSKRSAFNPIVSTGIGIHGFRSDISMDIWGEPYPVDSIVNVSSLSTDIKLGFVIDNNFFLYISRKDDWFNMTNPDNSNMLMSNSLSSISLQYFPNYSFNINRSLWWKPRFFFSFGYGYSIFGNFKDDEYESWNGSGIFLGMGHEISKNISIEFNFTITNSERYELIFDTMSPQLFINYTL